ncbi:MAG: helix-turn-helix transcriptional regulator [Erysipelotrichaceae bacterium]|nr:helix-turn-helix transcriptional regulator [Erysipelotrichaceae bacterium]
MTIGDRIREARIKKGLTQRELGTMLGVSDSAINSYENHSRGINSLLIIKLVRFLDVEPNTLFQDYFVFKEFKLSQSDKELLSNYNALDSYGRKNVQDILENEKNRMNEDRFRKKIIFRNYYRDLAAFENTDVSVSSDFAMDDSPANREVSALIPLDDDSLQPLYEPGQMLKIRRCERISYGQIGLFKVKGEYIFAQMGLNELEAVNKTFENIPYDDDVICLGEILGKQ